VLEAATPDTTPIGPRWNALSTSNVPAMLKDQTPNRTELRRARRTHGSHAPVQTLPETRQRSEVGFLAHRHSPIMP